MEASFSEDEWAIVEKWRKEHGYSRYRLVKEAVLEWIRASNEREAPTLDEFETEGPT